MAGRPERELPDDGAPLTLLALRLRSIREAAGKPSYRLLSEIAHRSQTTLSEAAGGVLLPTWETVEAFVLACGVDPDEVRPLWVAAGGRLPASPEPVMPLAPTSYDEAPPAGQDAEPDKPRRVWRRITIAVTALAVAGMALFAAFTLGRSAYTSSPAVASTEAAAAPVTRQVLDGSDPEDTGCARLPGVVLLDTTEVSYGGLPAGEAQLKYSAACGAAWPRFSPFPKANIPAGAAIHVDVVRPGTGVERFSFDAPYVGAPVFGNMALSTSDCVYAAVWIDDGLAPAIESKTHCFRGVTFVR